MVPSNSTNQTVYLQYGLIFKETTMDKFLKVFPNMDFYCFCNEGIGFKLETDYLRKCLAEQSNEPFWKSNYSKIYSDLRNPRNAVMKHRLFAFFGLDAEKRYAENLKSVK